MTWTPPEVKASTLRRRANEKRNKAARRRIRDIKGVWPVDDPEYLDWIRTLPCVVCFARRCGLERWLEQIRYLWRGVCMNLNGHHTQAAHVGAIRGHAQKCSDRETLPLCSEHHDRGQPEGHHVLGKRFWTFHGIDRDLILKALNCFYDGTEAGVHVVLT